MTLEEELKIETEKYNKLSNLKDEAVQKSSAQFRYIRSLKTAISKTKREEERQKKEEKRDIKRMDAQEIEDKAERLFQKKNKSLLWEMEQMREKDAKKNAKYLKTKEQIAVDIKKEFTKLFEIEKQKIQETGIEDRLAKIKEELRIEYYKGIEQHRLDIQARYRSRYPDLDIN